MTTIIDRLGEERLLAIVRAERVADARTIVGGLVEAGVAVTEISLSTATGLEAVARCADAHGDALILGAGTVLGVEQARDALAAGARFLVSPGFDPAVVAFARERGVLHLPGVFSPSEVTAALAAGAEVLKLFPAGLLGVGHLSDLRGPFPQARFVPTGGVDGDNAAGFLAAGAFAVAIGGALVPAGSAPSSGEVAEHARRVLTSLTSPVKELHGH
jgi:2-dehydro-3-deoxyphosphogluconate aldolase/(4S)-4-hydroxy-2-oxoglutarate aldolase